MYEDGRLSTRERRELWLDENTEPTIDELVVAAATAMYGTLLPENYVEPKADKYGPAA